jgi:dephospho-CoA kinase
MVTVAVTGGIACGKSLVGSFMADNDVAVCEADNLAHEVMQPGTAVFEAIVGHFGNGILGRAGNIDRRVLGQRVFSDSEARKQLNAMVHPAVRSAWEAWLGNRKAQGVGAAAVIVPLLYEAEADRGWNAVICVAASRASQMSRLLERGFTEAEARTRIGAQLALRDKMVRSDYVIVNDGTREALRHQTMKVLGNILET